MNAMGGDVINTSSGVRIYSGDVIISGGTLNATGGASTSDSSYGIFLSNGTLAFTGITLVAIGQTRAIYSDDPDLSAITDYTYWINAAASDPGGNGTVMPGGTPYSYSTDDKYVKITTPVPQPYPQPQPQPKVPQTGDSSNLSAWSAMVVSVLGVIFLAAWRKRRAAAKMR